MCLNYISKSSFSLSMSSGVDMFSTSSSRDPKTTLIQFLTYFIFSWDGKILAQCCLWRSSPGLKALCLALPRLYQDPHLSLVGKVLISNQIPSQKLRRKLYKKSNFSDNLQRRFCEKTVCNQGQACMQAKIFSFLKLITLVRKSNK